MDIDEVEAWLAKTLPMLLNDEFTPTDTLLLAVQCQVLLHLYHVIVALGQPPRWVRPETPPPEGTLR